MSAVTKLTGGNTSAVYEVTATDGRAVVVKLYSDLLHWKLQKEVFVYGHLRKHGVDVPVPGVLVADDSKTIVSQNVVVLTKLDGRHVYSLLDELDEADLVGVNRQIARLLRALHEVPFDAFGYVGADGVVDPHETNVQYMRFQFEKKLRGLAEHGGDAQLRRDIERYVADREELLAGPSRPAFCHNDCHYGNVLVLPGKPGWRVSGLLDFENVVAGDPLLDLAKTHCYAPDPSETLLAALADAYGPLRHNWRDAIDVYVLYHWLELWDWLAFVGEREPLPAIADDMRQLVSV